MIPRTVFDADTEGFREAFRKFLEQEAVPHHARWEKAGQVDRELWQKAGAMGFCARISQNSMAAQGQIFDLMQ